MSGRSSTPDGGTVLFFRSAIAALNANHNGRHLGHFFCSTAPQAFSRPDRVRSRPTRGDDVKGWPRSGHRRLGLYIGEHDGMLGASGRMIDLLACVFWRGRTEKSGGPPSAGSRLLRSGTTRVLKR